jgi:hypothetical protein
VSNVVSFIHLDVEILKELTGALERYGEEIPKMRSFDGMNLFAVRTCCLSLVPPFLEPLFSDYSIIAVL